LEQADEYCPYCDNHFVIEVAEQVESSDNHDMPGGLVAGATETIMIRSDNRFINDTRMKPGPQITEEEMIALMNED
jgi:hypothetical protein